MENILTIKNHQNFFFTIFGFLALLILTLIMLVIIVNSLLQNDDPMYAIFGFTPLFPFLMFFGLFLYLWLWNTFGKTEIKFDKNLILTNKNKLFSQPKQIEINEIKSVDFEDLTFERTKFNFRYHPFNNKAVKITTRNESFYAVKFVNDKEAMNVLNFIEENLKKF